MFGLNGEWRYKLNKTNHRGIRQVLLRNLQYHSQLIKSDVTIVYIGKEFECMACNSNLYPRSDYS